MRAAQKDFYIPFIKKEKVAEDTYSFYFRQDNQAFDFLPGQYIVITLDIKNPDQRGTSKPFTISSSSLEKQYITITTKVIQSTFKRKLAGLVEGEKVKFSGPYGGFVLKEEEKDERVFLAGGIGITPFHSMIAYASTKKLSIPITLIVSFSTIEDLVFYKELSDLASKNPNIKVVYTVSHPDNSNVQWEGEIGRISETLIKKYIQDIFKPQYFIVGPPAMVAAMEEVVGNMGVRNEKVFIENFTGY